MLPIFILFNLLLACLSNEEQNSSGTKKMQEPTKSWGSFQSDVLSSHKSLLAFHHLQWATNIFNEREGLQIEA